MIHRIVITPSLNSNKAPRHNRRGPLYDVAYNGVTIVSATTEPCLDGARALKAMGITGKLEMWDDVLPYCRLHADVGKAAELTVQEGEGRPTLRKFQAFLGHGTKDGGFGSEGTPIAPTVKSPPTDSPGGFAEQSAGGAP